MINDRVRDLVLQKSSSHVIREAAIECGHEDP